MSKVKVPTVDLKKAKDDPSQLKSLDKACRDHGFFLLKNHGMQEEIDDMWRMSEWFFNQPREDKLKIIRTESIPIGYYDRELTKQKRDLKEVFDFMETRREDDINQWPKEKEFKEVMETFFIKSSNVAEKTLHIVILFI